MIGFGTRRADGPGRDFTSTFQETASMSIPAALVRPPCVRSRHLVTPDGPLAALDAVPAGETRAVALLVPGITGSKEDFLPLLDRLAAAGVRTVAVDQRGQCDSPHLPRGRRYDLPGFGADVSALLNLLSETQFAGAAVPRHLLGHSFGGYAVREALISAAVRPPLASVTVLGSGPGAVHGPAAARLRRFRALSAILSLRQITMLTHVDRHPDPVVHEFLRHRWCGNDRASLRAMGRHLLTEPDRTDEFAEVLRRDAVRCLVVCGADEDTWPVEEQQAMARRLGARFTAIPGAVHSPNTQQPDLLTDALLGFWLG
jgi:pimeloyl-ACP methyl ester carboxylesterase